MSLAMPCKRDTICPISGPLIHMTEAPCFRQPMIDENCITDVKRELENSGNFRIWQQYKNSLMYVQIRGKKKRKKGKKETKWSVLYEKFEVRLVADGMGVYIDGAHLLPTRYEQALFKTEATGSVGPTL
jgi:hypothetical protein